MNVKNTADTETTPITISCYPTNCDPTNCYPTNCDPTNCHSSTLQCYPATHKSTLPPCNATLPPCNATLPPCNATLPPCNATLPPCNATLPRTKPPTTAPLAAARGEGWGWDCPLRGRTSRLPLRVGSQPLAFPLAFGAPSDCALNGRWRCRASPHTSASPSPTHTLAQIHPLPPCWLPASPHGGTSQEAQAPLRCCRVTPCQRPRWRVTADSNPYRAQPASPSRAHNRH